MTIRFQPVSGCALRALRPLSAALLCSTALMGNARAANPVLPTGGQAAAGQVSMSRTAGAQLTIVQTSQSAVINWQDFSIGVGASVNISQPNAAAALLNRVTGDTATTISGALNANGQVYLVNPNGVVISKSGLIIAGAFVASTLGISDSDFMAGNRSFSGHGSSASVSNSGAVILGRGGYAALMGGAVDNAGVISAPLGKVALASGERVTLDLSGDGFIQVALPTEAAGPGALINSSGLLSAAGGVIEIRAATALNAARNAVSLSGVADATAVSGANGRVILSGGTGGEVTVSGALMAPAPMGVGGSVSVDGVRVTLDGAMIDVSGAAGGGTIQIGGPVHGDLSSPQSTLTTIDAATILKADAVRTGPGGTLSIWSTGDTLYLGSLSARGGTEGGDGGSAEISAAGGLTFNGAVDLSAPNGKAGRLLLDPATLRVNQSTATSIGSVLNGGADVRIQTTSWAYSASPGVAISNQNTVLGDTSGDITINAPISWSSSAKLTISSFHSLNILAPITLSGAGSLDLETNSGNSGSDGALSFGLTANGFRGQVSYTGVGGSLTINGAAYTLLYSLTDIGDIPANSNGNFALAASLTGTGTADGAQSGAGGGAR